VTATTARRRLQVLILLRGVLTGEAGAAVRRGSRSGSWGRPHRPQPEDWPEILAVAEELIVTPEICRVVRETPTNVPTAVADQLREAHLGHVVRNLRFRHELTRAVQAFNRAGTVPLLMKGSLQLVDGTLGLGDRWMGDLDIVVPGADLSRSAEILVELGYRPDPGKPFLHPHELPFHRAGTPGPIEVHRELGSSPLADVLPVAEAWAASAELPIGQASARALSPTHQVLHNILHSAVQDLNHTVGGLPLRQLLTLAGLARVHGPAVDWPAIERRMQEHGLGGTYHDHLWLTHRLTGMALPDKVGGGPSARLHERWALASFALGWPADAQRNLRHAFGRAYLDSLYAHGNRPLQLAWARARHGVTVLRRDGRGAFEATLRRKD
jgi:hypothetical protein